MHFSRQIARSRLLFLIGLASFWAFIALPYIATSGWLFDDFAIIPASGNSSISMLLTSPLAGNYRPVASIFWHMVFPIFGWEHQWGYTLASAILHSLNALMLGILLAQRSHHYLSWLSASIFLLYSPINETVLWASCQFDLFATFFILLALLASELFILRENLCLRWAAFSSITLFSILACFSKENGLAVIVFFLAFQVMATSNWKELFNSKRMLVLLAIAMGCLVFLLTRAKVMNFRSSSYGDPIKLFMEADITANLLTYIKYAFTFHTDSMPWLNLVGTTIVAVASVMGMFLAPKACITLALSAIISLLPVLWARPGPGAPGGGRLIYVAILPLSILLAQGICQSAGILARLETRFMYSLPSISAIILLLILLVSFFHTAQRWSEAVYISKQVLYQVAKKAISEDVRHVYIKNMPNMFTELPYILKCYSFNPYIKFLTGKNVSFRCDMVLLSRTRDGGFEARAFQPDPFSNYHRPVPNEVELELTLLSKAECRNLSVADCLSRQISSACTQHPVSCCAGHEYDSCVHP